MRSPYRAEFIWIADSVHMGLLRNVKKVFSQIIFIPTDFIDVTWQAAIGIGSGNSFTFGIAKIESR